MAGRKLGDDEVLFHEPVLQRRVRSRMRLIQRRPEHRDGATAVLERLLMSGRIDSRASPLTITTSRSTIAPTSLATRLRPGSDAFREPTTATRAVASRRETSRTSRAGQERDAFRIR
jgi:hypothetical protein